MGDDEEKVLDIEFFRARRELQESADRMDEMCARTPREKAIGITSGMSDSQGKKALRGLRVVGGTEHKERP